jgi:hypothetical protein
MEVMEPCRLTVALTTQIKAVIHSVAAADPSISTCLFMRQSSGRSAFASRQFPLG